MSTRLLPSTHKASVEPSQPGFCVGHGILVPASGWTFGGDVWRSFDRHIRASVPGYAEVQQAIVELAAEFASEPATLCDLGCSTGTLTRRLAERYPSADVLGIDHEPAMIAAAVKLNREWGRYLCADLETVSLPRISFASACYTLMFLPGSARLPFAKKLYQALEPGGAFVLAEKVRRRDPTAEARCRDDHLAFKLRQGLTPRQIELKARSLRGSLEPWFEDENPVLLRRAGFAEVRLLARHTCFDTWLARRA